MAGRGRAVFGLVGFLAVGADWHGWLLDDDEVLVLMRRDKMVVHGRLLFVMPTTLGHVELVDNLPSDDVRASLETRHLAALFDPERGKMPRIFRAAPGETRG